MKLEPANIVCPACGNGNYMRHLIGKNVGYLDTKCINCNSYFNFDELYKRRIGEALKPEPQTHYDRIISKTPEELADYLWSVKKYDRPYDKHISSWLRWLKAPADKERTE